jgi:FkbM family methyltransferase
VLDALRHPEWVFRRYYWSWVIRRRRPTVLTKRTANGLLSFDTRDQTIGRALYIKRRYETELVHHALAVLRAEGHLSHTPAGCVLDIGANIGVICIALLEHGYFREAVAVEPDPMNFALLERNVAQNGFRDRIRCFQYALSAQAGTALLERSEGNWGGHHILAAAADRPSGTARGATVQVGAVTLDRLVMDDQTLRRPDSVGLLWMDVEGHEGWCLKGARQFAARGVPVVTEFWPDGTTRSGMTAGEYSALLTGAFTHFYLGPDEESPTRAFRKYPISEIARLFTRRLGHPECTIILVHAPWPG